MYRRDGGIDDCEVVTMSDFGTLSEKEVVDIITGRRIIKNEQERALVMLQIDGVYYDFSDDEALELFERFENKELTREQMSFHIIILALMSENISRNKIDLLTKSKNKLLEFLNNDISYRYLDEPILEEDIKIIESFFKEEVAVC